MTWASELLGVQSYNVYNKPLNTIDEGLKSTSHILNSFQKLLSDNDLNGNEFQYSYDDNLGTLQETKIFRNDQKLENHISYQYSPSDHKLTEISNLNYTLKYTYFKNTDLVQKLEYFKNAQKKYEINYSYVPRTKLVSRLSDNFGNEEQSFYDEFGRLKEYHVTHPNFEEISYSYEYDLFGRLSRTTSSNHFVTSYEYDNFENISKINYKNDFNKINLEYNYKYNSSKNMIFSEMNYLNFAANDEHHLQTRYKYNSNNYLVEYEVSNTNNPSDIFLFPRTKDGMIIAKEHYAYNLDKSVASVQTFVKVTKNNHYVTLKEAFDNAIYEYDDANNSSTELKNIFHSYLPWNENQKTILYDNNGNMTQDNFGNQIHYNALNEMISFDSRENLQNSRNYSYYPTGTLATLESPSADKETNIEPTQYFYSGHHQLIQQSQGNSTVHWTNHLDKMISGKNSFIQYSFMDVKGNVVGSYNNDLKNFNNLFQFTPYGEKTSLISLDKNHSFEKESFEKKYDITKNVPDFGGQETDEETHLQFKGGYRAYNPALKMFIKKDRYNTFQRVMNAYGYADANPILFQDPSGHTSLDEQISEILHKRTAIEWADTLFNTVASVMLLRSSFAMMAKNSKLGYLLLSSGTLGLISTEFNLAGSFTTGSLNAILQTTASFAGIAGLGLGLLGGAQAVKVFGAGPLLGTYSSKATAFFALSAIGTGIASHFTKDETSLALHYASWGSAAAAMTITGVSKIFAKESFVLLDASNITAEEFGSEAETDSNGSSSSSQINRETANHRSQLPLERERTSSVQFVRLVNLEDSIAIPLPRRSAAGIEEVDEFLNHDPVQSYQMFCPPPLSPLSPRSYNY